MGTEQVSLDEALGRVVAEDIVAEQDLPGFDRSTMDGFAVMSSSTFGASEGNPAYLSVVGAVGMGQIPGMAVGAGQAVRIATGGMLPDGADSVVMVEHTDAVDDETIEVYRSVAPASMWWPGTTMRPPGSALIAGGTCLRAQELGVLAACGFGRVPVFQRPRVGSSPPATEVVPVEATPAVGQVRDINGHTLAGLIHQAGAVPRHFGIVKDRLEALSAVCRQAVEESDMVLISGGSSVGTRDLTLDVLSQLPESEVLVHGVSIRPGKPTILARCGAKAFWGLPGHVTSAMIVFMIVVRPFLAYISGLNDTGGLTVRARLSRNLASVQGRADYVRVRLFKKEGESAGLWAEPVLGASGLIRTMVAADGLVAIDLNSEGYDAGTPVDVMLLH